MSINFPQDNSTQQTYSTFPYNISDVDPYVSCNLFLNENKNTSNYVSTNYVAKSGGNITGKILMNGTIVNDHSLEINNDN